MFTMDDLLEVAIKMEENGETSYRTAIEKVKNKDLKNLLRWMADEEAIHCRWFTDQKDHLSLEMDEIHLKQMVPQVLQDMMGEKTLSLDEINFTEISTSSELLETFIGFEKDTILFYELLEMFIEQEIVLNGLKKIILEEKHHVEKLTLMMASLAEEAV